MTTPPFIVIADPVCIPRFPARVLRTCEEVYILLEDTPVDELWISVDMQDVSGVNSVVDYLVIEEGWQGESQIGIIVLFGERREDVAQLEERLRDRYPLRWQPVTDELFEPLPA